MIPLGLAQDVGYGDDNEDDHVQNVVAVLPVLYGLHIDLHEELRDVDGDKAQL